MSFIAASVAVGVAGTGLQAYGASQSGKGAKKAAKRAEAQAAQDYSRRMGEWQAYWNERLPRLTNSQRRYFDQLNSFVEEWKPKILASYDPTAAEKAFEGFVNEVNDLTAREHGEVLAGIEQLKRELDPVFRQKTTEAEHELRRGRADALEEFYRANARNVARGGTSWINAERRDEALSRGYARAADESRALARKQAEDTLFKSLGQRATTGQHLIANKQALIPQYQTLAEKERARQEGRLTSEMDLAAAPMRNQQAFDLYLDNLLNQQYSSTPQYIAPGAPPPEPNPAEGWGAVGSSAERLIEQLAQLYKPAATAVRPGTTTTSPWTDASGDMWLQNLRRWEVMFSMSRGSRSASIPGSQSIPKAGSSAITR